MNPLQIALYLGGAMAYALALGAVLFILARLAVGLRFTAGRAALVVLTLFVVFLGLHPFPDRATLDCSKGGAEMLLTPFGFVDGYVRYWQQGRPLEDWLRSLSIISPVMNVIIFALPGAALALQTRSWGVAALFSAGLTTFIELSQVSALYGIYPCPYRHFEVDDLILNFVGTFSGFALMRRRARHAA